MLLRLVGEPLVLVEESDGRRLDLGLSDSQIKAFIAYLDPQQTGVVDQAALTGALADSKPAARSPLVSPQQYGNEQEVQPLYDCIARLESELIAQQRRYDRSVAAHAETEDRMIKEIRGQRLADRIG